MNATRLRMTGLGAVLAAALAAGLVAVMPGCSFSWSEERHYAPRQVVVAEGHVHSRHCEHCYDDGRWITISARHVHGPGCGHEFNGNCWVVVRSHRPAPRPVPQRVVPVEHIHSASCGCVWDGVHWVHIEEGHVHGHGCGHVYIEGRWTIRRR